MPRNGEVPRGGSLSVSGDGRSWSEVFPWLEELGGRPFRNWLAFDAVEHLGSTDPIIDHTWDVAEVVMARLGTDRLADLFPTVDPESSLEVHLPGASEGRPSNATEWIRTGDLLACSARDLGDHRGWGPLHVLGVIRELVILSLGLSPGLDEGVPAIEDDQGTELVPTVDGVESIDWGPQREVPPTPMAERIMAALATIARWRLSREEADVPVMAGLQPEAPDEVREAQDWVNSLGARDLLDLSRVSSDREDGEVPGQEWCEDRVPQVLESILSALPQRDLDGLARRCLLPSRETLDAIGRDWGVTRERVRQVVARAEAALRESMDGERGLVRAFEEARDRIAPVMSLGELTCEFPWLETALSSTGGHVSDVFRWWCGDVEFSEGWCARPSMGAVRGDLSSVLSELANPEGIVALSDIDATGGREQLLDPSWIAHCGYRTVGVHVVPPYRSLSEESVVVLSACGIPMTVEEIAALIPKERSARSVSNRMAEDDRMMRVDRDKWALTRWGMEPYENITSLIDGFLEESGGSAALSDVTRGLTSRYAISEKSVAAYANAFPFVVRRGIVSRGTKSLPVKASVRNTPRLYRSDGSWLLRIEVNREHLRGSGFPAPMALVQIAGLEPGDRREYVSEVGRQAVSWRGPQPTFGSVRALLIARDIGEGSQVFIRLGDDGSFDISPVRVHTEDALDGALALVGVGRLPADEDPWLTLARSIELPDKTGPGVVAEAFRDRGDVDVAALIDSARSHAGTGA